MRTGLQTVEAFLAAGNARTAAEHVRQYIAEFGEERYALILLARAELMQSDPNAASDTAQRLVALDPDDPVAYRLLGIAELQRRKPKKAKELFDLAISRDPNHAWTYLQRASISDAQGHHDAAVRDYERALQLDPEDPEALAGYGGFLHKIGRRAEGEAMLDRAGAVAPDDTGVLVARGEAALRTGRIAEARDFALWALRIDAEDRNAIGLLCSIKASRHPILGIWWLWVSFLERYQRWARIAVAIGVYVGFQLFVRVLVPSLPEPESPAMVVVWSTFVVLIVLLWAGFCVLTWIGPWLLRRMIAKELKTVKLRPDF